MKIPHTIPQFILRAYAQKLTPEKLITQYEGRILRSEDPTWDKDLKPTLAQLCLDLLIKDYTFYVRLTDELNRLGGLSHDQAYANWEKSLENYKKRKLSFERKVLQLEIDGTRRSHNEPEEPDSDDSDDDELKISRIPIKPTEVPEEFTEYVPILPVLDRLNDTDRTHVIEELDFEEIPLAISIASIPDEHYWERCCNDRWPEFEPYEHENSWRTMYIERHLRNCIEEFHPLKGHMSALHTAIDLCAPFVNTMVIHSLIPVCFEVPLKPFVPVVFDADESLVPTIDDAGFEESEYIQEMRTLKEEQTKKEKEREENDELLEETFGDDDEVDKTSTNSSHINFTLVLPLLVKLTKLSIVYGMAELGTDYEPRYTEFTWTDCENLAKALALSPTIEIFELNKSAMTDEQTKLLVREGLLLMPHLKILNLSYNKLGCAGAKAIARLICDVNSRVVHTLHSLYLTRNQIRNPGAEALAYALTQNNHLHFLDLRLNYIRNNGGSDLAHALAKNTSIQVLNLNANYLGPRACYVIGKMLRHNKTLVELDLSSNDLGAEGGESLVSGLRDSRNILKMDVRMTNMGVDLEYEIMAQVRQNRSICHHNLLEEDDVYPPDTESVLEFEADEEEEEEEDEEEEDVREKGSSSSSSGSMSQSQSAQ